MNEVTVKAEKNQPDQNLRAAALEASQKMAQTIVELTQEFPDMTVVEFGKLCLGGLKGGVTGYKMIMEAFVKSARMLQIGETNPYELRAKIKAMKDAAKAETPAPATKRSKRK
jgi:hypothetical protein